MIEIDPRLLQFCHDVAELKHKPKSAKPFSMSPHQQGFVIELDRRDVRRIAAVADALTQHLGVKPEKFFSASRKHLYGIWTFPPQRRAILKLDTTGGCTLILLDYNTD